MTNFSIDIEKLVKFFDEDETAKPHASSIKNLIGEEFAFAILNKYFKKTWESVELLKSPDGKRIPCTTGGTSRSELDGWLELKKKTKLNCIRSK